jgi:hypothetical protein
VAFFPEKIWWDEGAVFWDGKFEAVKKYSLTGVWGFE